MVVEKVLRCNREYAAGVLFYYNNKGSILFLLGKDYRYKWSDFGGKEEIYDKDMPYLTASRECYEETMGVVYSEYELRHYLKGSKYVVGKSYMNKPYYMFLIELKKYIEYQDELTIMKVFNKILPQYFTEKNQMKWYSLREIVHNSDEKIRKVFYQTFINNLQEIQKITNAVI